jgi:hypothetical protein
MEAAGMVGCTCSVWPTSMCSHDPAERMHVTQCALCNVQRAMCTVHCAMCTMMPLKNVQAVKEQLETALLEVGRLSRCASEGEAAVAGTAQEVSELRTAVAALGVQLECKKAVLSSIVKLCLNKAAGEVGGALEVQGRQPCTPMVSLVYSSHCKHVEQIYTHRADKRHSDQHHLMPYLLFLHVPL